MTDPQRDRYIIKMALAYAIEAIDRLPKRWQSSVRDDMLKLLEHYSRATPENFPADFWNWLSCEEKAETLERYSRNTVEYHRIDARSCLARRDITVDDSGQFVLAFDPALVVPFPK
jgi:hypothetical protein